MHFNNNAQCDWLKMWQKKMCLHTHWLLCIYCTYSAYLYENTTSESSYPMRKYFYLCKKSFLTMQLFMNPVPSLVEVRNTEVSQMFTMSFTCRRKQGTYSCMKIYHLKRWKKNKPMHWCSCEKVLVSTIHYPPCDQIPN